VTNIDTALNGSETTVAHLTDQNSGTTAKKRRFNIEPNYFQGKYLLVIFKQIFEYILTLIKNIEDKLEPEDDTDSGNQWTRQYPKNMVELILAVNCSLTQN
jgi:hypothetical protein